MVERAHRVLKASLMARKDDWLASLPVVLLGLRCIPTESGVSPFTLVTGGMLLSPKIMVTSQIPTFAQQKEIVSEFVKRMRELDFSESSYGYLHSSNVKPYVPKDLESCPYVWVRVDRVRRPLEAPYFGPLEVVERGDKYFILRQLSGTLITVSVDWLKPASLPNPVASDHESEQTENYFSEQIVNNPSDSEPPSEVNSSTNIPSNPFISVNTDEEVEENVPQPIETRSRRIRFNRNPDYVYY